jgi:hypothetical protein
MVEFLEVNMRTLKLVVAALAVAPLLTQAAANDDTAAEGELSQKLQNPVANLISVPLQNNWDFGIGPAGAIRYTGNIPPVIPVALKLGAQPIQSSLGARYYAESRAAVRTGVCVSPSGSCSRDESTGARSYAAAPN